MQFQIFDFKFQDIPINSFTVGPHKLSDTFIIIMYNLILIRTLWRILSQYVIISEKIRFGDGGQTVQSYVVPFGTISVKIYISREVWLKVP